MNDRCEEFKDTIRAMKREKDQNKMAHSLQLGLLKKSMALLR